MDKKKLLTFTVLPAFALTLVGAGVASAHGNFADRKDMSAEERAEHREERKANKEAHKQELADLLGLEVDDLKEAKEAGKTLEELAEEQGVDLAAFREQKFQERKANRLEKIAERVAAGDITQEQADERIEKMEEMEARRAEAIANGEKPERPHKRWHKHGHGPDHEELED